MGRVGYFGPMQNHSLPSRRPHSTPQLREELVAKYQASDLTQREFAQQHGVKLGTFQRWIYRPRLSHPIASTKKPAFQEVSMTEVPFLNSWAAELQLPRGVVLRLNSHARAEWIGALVQKLAQIC